LSLSVEASLEKELDVLPSVRIRRELAFEGMSRSRKNSQIFQSDGKRGERAAEERGRRKEEEEKQSWEFLNRGISLP
jgi:hypothetical protein